MNVDFLNYLNDCYEEENSWWRTLVNSPQVFLALRPHAQAINAYVGGASVARINWNGGNVQLQVHVEYLALPANHVDDSYVNLLGNNEHIAVHVIATTQDFVHYFDQICARATLIGGGAERRATNTIARLHCVVDMEAAFQVGADGSPVSGRVDLVALSPRGKLVFIEAKCYNNPELRSRAVPPVVSQLDMYHRWLVGHGADIVDRYSSIVSAFRVLHGDFFAARQQLPLMLHVDVVPRLLIFDFDRPQLTRLNSTTIPEIITGLQPLLPNFTDAHVARVGGAASVTCDHLGVHS